MNYYVFSLKLIVMLGICGNSFGYKWVSIDFHEEQIPLSPTLIYKSNTRYVGRAKHFGKVLPAEITVNPIKCLITSCNKLVPKHECQVLVEDKVDSCNWLPYNSDDESDENSLRIGTDSDNEPIFLGVTKIDVDGKYHITGIFSSAAAHSWIGSDPANKQYYYQCEPRTKWMDSSFNDQLPSKAISGGELEDGHEIYVARLEDDCNILTGQITSRSENATALSYDDHPIESPNYQVLVGKESRYVWVSASNGEIPDYAVVQGKNGDELAYVARYNKAIGHMTYKKAHKFNLEYEILAYNYNNA